MAEGVNLSKKNRKILVDHIRETGNVAGACALVGITVREFTKLRKDHIQLDEEVQFAVELASSDLEEEARRRAVIGVNEPVFYQGEECAVVKKYSDSLMTTLLKANLPEKFRERVDMNHTGEVNIVVNGYKQFKDRLKEQTHE